MQREFYQLEQRRQQIIGYFYINGKRIRRRLSGFGTLGLNAEGKLVKGGIKAEKALSRRLDELHRTMERKLLEGDRIKKARSQMVKQLLQEWIDWASAHRALGTQTKYSVTANQYIRAVGNHEVQDITIRHIDRFVTGLRQHGIGPVTINMRLDTFRAFLNWAKEREELERLPPIRHVPVEQYPPRVPTEENVNQLMARIHYLRTTTHRRDDSRRYLHHERFLMIAIHTGMRRAEICFLPWNQINIREGIIHIRGNAYFEVKEKRGKDIPMTAQLLQYLIQEQQPDEFWVLDDGKGNPAYTDPHSISTAFRRHFAAIGLGGMGLKAVHCFRALYAGRLRRAGIDLSTIQGLLGHRQIRTTQIYFPGEVEIQKKAVANLPSFGAELAQGNTPSPLRIENTQ